MLIHEDRLLPADPVTRGVALRLYNEVRNLPIVSPHGHTDPRWYAEDQPFADPARLFVVPDHYIFRMLYSQGVRLEDLGVGRRDGGPVESDGRRIWRLFAENYHLFRGTPTRAWLDHAFATLFGLERRLSAETADLSYDTIAEALARPEYRPRALFERFNIEVIATTESPLDDLRWHRMIRESGWGGRVITAYRPDPVVDPDFEGFRENVSRLGEVTGEDTSSWSGYLAAGPVRILQDVRRHLDRPRPSDGPHGRPRATGRRGPVPPRPPRTPLRRGRRTLPRPDAHRNGTNEPR